jgi:hypothetical protein
MFRILALMKVTENDVELLNCINCCKYKNSTEWQELGQVSNEPWNDFSRYSVKDTSAFEQAHEALTDCTAYVFLLLWLTKRQLHDCTRCWSEVGEMGLPLTQALAVAEVAEPCMARRGTAKDLKRDDVCSLRHFVVLRLIHTADSVCIGRSIRRGRKTTYWHPIS